MKKRFNIRPFQLFALIVVVFTSFSCSEKIFNEQNGETITPDQHYKSLIDAQVSLFGAIAPLQNVMPKLILIDGLRSDQMITRPNADPFLKDINAQVLSFDNPYLDASDYYKVIVNVNEALANIDKISVVDLNFNALYLKYTKGGLITLRSWTYLNLVRLYGQAALIDDNLASLPQNLNQNILPKDVIIDTLINRLLPYIPTDAELISMAELTIPGYMNSKAVLGELYLEKGDYAHAVQYLKMACESYKNNPEIYKVSSYSNGGWRTIFLGGISTENISVMSYSLNERQNNPLARLLLPTDQFMVQPTRLLVDSFKTQVPSKGVNGDVYRGLGTVGSDPATIDTTRAGVFFINKYSMDKNDPFSAPIIISRAADLHLLLAEALNRNGDSKTALILMNSGFKGEKTVPGAYNRWSRNLGIRGRAYLKSKVVPDSILIPPAIKKVPFTGEARTIYVEDLIMDERALELAFEGKRWFDLVRIAKRRNDNSYLANKVAAKFSDPGEKEAVRQKLMIETNWYLPFKK